MVFNGPAVFPGGCAPKLKPVFPLGADAFAPPPNRLLLPVLPEGAVDPPPKRFVDFCSAPDVAVPPNNDGADVAADVVLLPVEPNSPPPDEAPKLNGDAPDVCVALLPPPPKRPPV